MLLLQVPAYSGLVGKANVTVGAMVWPCTTVQVHVVMQRGFLGETLAANETCV